MFKFMIYILFITTVLSICINTLAQDDPIVVELQANKKEYICGEPILLKTTVVNTSENTCVLSEAGYQWGRNSFTMSVAYNDDEFADIFTLLSKLNIMVPASFETRMSFPYYVSNFIPKSLNGKQRVETTDLIFVPIPGDYKFKCVLKDLARKVKTYESEPISFKVLSLNERKDSISQFGDPNLISVRLGLSIFYAHYAGRVGYSTAPEGPIGQEAFDKIAPEIINNHKDSVFREYVLYADIMAHEQQGNRSSYHPLSEKYKQEALDFAKEYPDSWLLPLVYRKLGDTFIYEKDLDKAEEYIDKSYELAPNASFLGAAKGQEVVNAVRQRTGNTIAPKVQAPPVPVTLPKKKPIGLALPIGGAAIAVIVIAGVIIFLRKKKLKKAE